MPGTNKLNKLLNINPLTFRNKSLLPKNFVSNFVSIEKYDSNTSIKIDTSQSTKDDNSLLNFRAETFINSYFLEDGTWIEWRLDSWEYNLSFRNSEGNNSNEKEFRLSERKGANTWYGGDPVNGLIFKLPLNLIDLLYSATTRTD